MTNRSPVDPAAILFKGVGTWDAIAIAVAGMAPTMAMNLNPQEPAEHVGRVVPLVFALSTIVVLLVAWCFARLARDHPNAGSAYGFVAAILGPRAGLVAGWTLLGTYLCFAAVGLGAFGLFGANLLQRTQSLARRFHLQPDDGGCLGGRAAEHHSDTPRRPGVARS